MDKNLKNYKIVFPTFIQKLLKIAFFALLFSGCSVLNFHQKSMIYENQTIENYKNGEFVNTNPTEMITESFFKIGYKFMFENTQLRKPNFEIPTEKINIDSFSNLGDKNLSATWLGHSTVLINIDGTLILTDPMFSKWAAPINWFGPKRFFNPPIEIEELPILDAVIISHNHYDHLDKESVLRLNGLTKIFIVPIGVGKYLEDWGISTSKIVEKNWWESYKLNDKIDVITTPAQHFSGRGLFDRNKSLWASFVIKSKNHSIYFGGDSGYFQGYKEIGEKFGPFEITILPIGAYNKMWKSIHTDSEEAVKAHIDLKGELLLPIHWGTFNLALHSWIEPVEQLIIAANKAKIEFVIPKAGKIVDNSSKHIIEKWWIFNDNFVKKVKNDISESWNEAKLESE